MGATRDQAYITYELQAAIEEVMSATRDQAYITYEQLIWLCRLWILKKWFASKKQK